VAEEVAKVNPDLVARDEEGKPYTVRYEAVNAMLLNEFLKAHHKAEQQEATIGKLNSVVAKQQEQIAALASQIKTVSNRLELSQGAPRVVASEP
jgi:trimeric autotransporter adhesin